MKVTIRLFIGIIICGLMFVLGALADRKILSSKNYILKPVAINPAIVGTGAEYLNSARAIKIGSFTVVHAIKGHESLTIGTDDNNPPGIVVDKNDKGRTDINIADRRNHILQGVFENGYLASTSVTKDVISGGQYTQVFDLHANGIYNMLYKFSKSGIEKLLLVNESWYPFETKNEKKIVHINGDWREAVDCNGIIKLIQNGTNH